MLIHYDPDRYTTEVKTSTCAYHQQHPGKAYAGCTCSTSYGSVRRSDEEYRRIRAERVRKEEDEILARAEGIKFRRSASGMSASGRDREDGHEAKPASPTREAGDAQ